MLRLKHGKSKDLCSKLKQHPINIASHAKNRLPGQASATLGAAPNHCKFERLVAFSCKKRGFCASYGARRMNETSIHLSDNVFPASTLIRQWVLSIPVPLRYLCARNSALQSKILRLTNSVIAKSIKNSVPGLNNKNKKLQTGAVTLIQRFGGHVNLNIHFHMLHVQGAWEISDDKTTAPRHARKHPSRFNPKQNRARTKKRKKYPPTH